MKRIITIPFILLLFIGVACGKKSPKMVSAGKIGNSEIKITYSSPAVKSREIFGGLVPYDKVWRTGADEATVFETSKDITIEGKALKAGKYELFTIPSNSKWTIIIQTYQEQWGAYSYKKENDVLRVEVPSKQLDKSIEDFTIIVEDAGVTLEWEKTIVFFKVS